MYDYYKTTYGRKAQIALFHHLVYNIAQHSLVSHFREKTMLFL